MELNPKIKVNDLLAQYPFLKDFLIKLNPEFKMLDNPFMRKTVGRIASLQKAAMIGGMDVKKLLDDIARRDQAEDEGERSRYPTARTEPTNRT